MSDAAKGLANQMMAPFLEDIPENLLLYLKTLVIFTIIAIAYLVITRRAPLRLTPRGLADLFREVFPARLYGRAVRVDKWNAVLVVFLVGPLVSVMSVVLALLFGVNVKDALDAAFGSHQQLFHADWAILTVEFLAFLFIGSFVGYWMHYAEHKVPLLWSWHRAHHSVEERTMLANWRGHPLEFLFGSTVGSAGTGLATGLVMYFMGLDLHPGLASIFLAQKSIQEVWNYFAHSHIPIYHGRFNAIIGSPAMHQIHHSVEPHQRDKNMGGMIMIWDWMFGTLYIPKRDEEYRWGLNEEEMGENNPHKTLKNFYLEPLQYAWAQLVGTGRGRKAGA